MIFSILRTPYYKETPEVPTDYACAWLCRKLRIPAASTPYSLLRSRSNLLNREMCLNFRTQEPWLLGKFMDWHRRPCKTLKPWNQLNMLKHGYADTLVTLETPNLQPWRYMISSTWLPLGKVSTTTRRSKKNTPCYVVQ